MDESKKPTKANTVLVIDDSDIDRQVMVDLVARAGFEVHDLPTAIGATRAAREHGARVVVIDQNLPALNGAKLAQLFRSNPSMREIKLILISSNDEATMSDLVREARADAFVSKDRMHSDLVPTIKRLL
ncbi:MAG TPA: response regulator [Polyangiales bacterium]|nr:response regulator [Polyangiales bacterium]